MMPWGAGKGDMKCQKLQLGLFANLSLLRQVMCEGEKAEKARAFGIWPQIKKRTKNRRAASLLDFFCLGTRPWQVMTAL